MSADKKRQIGTRRTRAAPQEQLNILPLPAPALIADNCLTNVPASARRGAAAAA